MKKYIYNAFVLAMGMFAATSCSPEFQGQEEGNDAAPRTIMYQYTPTAADGNYDADTDIRLRLTGNNKTTQVYYLAMKTTEREALSEEQLISKVKSNGASVSNPGGGVDVYVTGMQGANTIVAVATDGKKDVISEITFFGKTWTTVAKGALTARFLTGSSATVEVSGLELQHSEDNPENYRVKNALGEGIHLPLQVTGDTMDSDAYRDEPSQIFTVAKTAMNATYSSYGTVSIADYYTYSGDESYLEYNNLYKDYSFRSYCAYTVSAGRITSGYIYFTAE